ncbi:hypothetical protein L7F22_020543 [Adiantum nelumboides]|nr:hypothetical protein [Adiantum nelumboides]
MWSEGIHGCTGFHKRKGYQQGGYDQVMKLWIITQVSMSTSAALVCLRAYMCSLSLSLSLSLPACMQACTRCVVASMVCQSSYEEAMLGMQRRLKSSNLKQRPQYPMLRHADRGMCHPGLQEGGHAALQQQSTPLKGSQEPALSWAARASLRCHE